MEKSIVYIATRVALQFRPELVWNRQTGAPLLIPHCVEAALRRKGFGQLLEEAAQQNRVVLCNPVDPVDLSEFREKFKQISHDADWPSALFVGEQDFMDPPDEALKVAGEILALVKTHPRVCVVAQYDDREYYRLLGLNTCSPDSIIDSTAPVPSNIIIIKRKNLQGLRVLGALSFLLILSSIAIGFIWRDPQTKKPITIAMEWVASHVSQQLGTPGLVGIALSSGFALYLLRSRRRLYYGLIEIVIGAILFCGSVPIAGAGIPSLLPMTGGLYVIVRGLDNLGKWVRDSRDTNPAVYSAWARIFSDRF